MGKNELVQVTAEQAHEAGLLIQDGCKHLASIQHIEETQGAAIASMMRLHAVDQLHRAMSTPQAEALIFVAAKHNCVEVAGNPTDAQLLDCCRQAVQRGYLLSDANGPQFTVFASGGKASVMVKEVGYRHRLKERGARKVRAAAFMIEGKNPAEILMIGFAECQHDGETVRVDRTAEMPIRLTSKGGNDADKFEAQARRRLVRDLWSVISGEECDSDAAIDEAEAVIAQPAVRSMLTEAPEPPDEMDPAKLFEMDVDSLRRIAAKMQDKSEREALADIVKAIAAADMESLQASAADWTEAARMHSRTIQNFVANLITYKRAMLAD
jgi:hypothetical protein